MLLELHPIVERTSYGVSGNDILRGPLSTIHDSSKVPLIGERERDAAEEEEEEDATGLTAHCTLHTAHSSKQMRSDETAK